MPTHYRASDHRDWAAAGLKDFTEFSDCVEYVNERESGYGDCEGEWWYADDDTLTVYGGTHGNDHSPGASSCTFANVYDNVDEYRARVADLKGMPEFLPSEEEDGEDD